MHQQTDVTSRGRAAEGEALDRHEIERCLRSLHAPRPDHHGEERYEAITACCTRHRAWHF